MAANLRLLHMTMALNPVPTIRHAFFLLSIVAVTSVSSCIGLKRFSAIVEKKVRTIPTEDLEPSSNFRFLHQKKSETNWQVKTVRKRNLFIPALVYWQWESSFLTQFEPGFASNLFEKRLLAHSEQLGIKKALDGKVLEVKIENLPDGFEFSRTGAFIYLVFVYATASNETIQPQKKDPLVLFTLRSDTAVLLNDTVTVKNPLVNTEVNVLKRTYRFTDAFIDSYLANVDQMALSAAKQMRASLEKELALPPLPEGGDGGNSGF